MRRIQMVVDLLVGVYLAWAIAGCTMTEGTTSGRSVGDVWEEPTSPPAQQSPDLADRTAMGTAGTAKEAPPTPIATVNGKPINRAAMMDLLIRTRGLSVLEELVARDLARQAAEAEGVSITPADIQAEYDRSLAQISSPVPTTTQPLLAKEARETLLSEILRRRGLSREEFGMAMERQACLRKIAEKRLQITEPMLRTQYEMMYDARVQVRHIQVADWRDVSRVQKMLEAGKDFAEVARTCSQNLNTAPEGGLLPPFSRNQDDVPPLLRDAAFSLAVGQVSNPIRIDNDYHLIKPVQRFDRSQVQFEHVKEIVRMKLIERLLPEAMAKIERDLFNKAQIVITEPRLRQQFDEKYGRTKAVRGGN